ncbi:MAG TPA: DUF4340 domain-containing protein [Candidatus Acidoferrales bacterium]|nr:DUF4340 domain-containing protein [Candidatus Acidoferrales bacterium]
MRSGKTLALAVIFVALAAYVYFFEWRKETGERREKLLNFSPEEAAVVELKNPAGEIRLERENAGGWKLTAPLKARADRAAVQSLLETLSAAEVARTVVADPPADELKNFGLDQPAARLSVTLKSGVTLPGVLIGGQTPVGQSLYARREVKPDVLLVDGALRPVLERKVDDFRDRNILEIKEEALRRIALKSATAQWTLAKKDNDWALETPRAAPVERARIDKLIVALKSLRAQDFIDAPSDRSRYGLEQPRLRLEIEQNGRQVELSVGKARAGKGESFVAVSTAPTIYAVSDAALAALERDGQALVAAAENKQAQEKPPAAK